jgi:Mg2+ and Co2+ transporter CorA
VVIKRLASLMLLLLPLLLLAAVLGMNVPIPGQVRCELPPPPLCCLHQLSAATSNPALTSTCVRGAQTSAAFFYAVVGVMAAMLILFALLFRRLNWLE